MKNITDVSLILSTNRALLSEVRPNMRRVTIDYVKKENLVGLIIYYDKPLDQDELDDDVPGIIITQVSSDFPQNVDWKDEVVVCPYPNKIPSKGLCVFQRYEPSLHSLKECSPIDEEVYSDINNISLILSANRALLCEIRPAMRGIMISYNADKNAITLTFYLNYFFFGMENCLNNIITKNSSYFSQKVDWKKEVTVLPYPEKFPGNEGIFVFLQHESYSSPFE